MYSYSYTIIAIAALCLIAGCAAEPRMQRTATQRPYVVEGKRYEPLDSAEGYSEKGIASWYGADFHGRKTSSGETYDMYDMTAAHKTLPLGTYVRVTRLDNTKEVMVRVNDRGPFVRGRIIDLSYNAADALGIVNEGTAIVMVEALGEKVGSSYVARDYRRGSFTIQVGAFRIKENAFRLRERLDKVYGGASIQVYDRGDGLFYRVRVGKYVTMSEAEGAKDSFEKAGFDSPFVVAE